MWTVRMQKKNKKEKKSGIRLVHREVSRRHGMTVTGKWARTDTLFVVVSELPNWVATELECVPDTDTDADAPMKEKPALTVLVVLDAFVVVVPDEVLRPYVTDSVTGVEMSL
jgi:hypothetical protein